jgi:16S rRNA (guanine527-N7)-methyltransferase
VKPEEPVELLEGLNVSRETERLLLKFVDLVAKWTARINLISGNSLGAIWSRHVLDSAQLFTLAPSWCRNWVDLGSGAGFPAMIISLLAQDQGRPIEVTMVESDQRKAAFLRTAARELGIAPQIVAGRIEQLPSLQADILSARALAGLPILLHYAQLHLQPTGVTLFPKGRSALEEIAIARKSWQFDLVVYPSITDPDAQILKIEKIAHV